MECVEQKIPQFSIHVEMKTSIENNKLTRDEIIFLAAAFLFGIIIRFYPGTQVGFPLNDGGMFMSMIRDLRASHYALPAVTSYNQLDIPYAYPPFGFYFARLVSDVFNLSEITLLRWLPPAINTLSISAFYLLANVLLESRKGGVFATLFYSLTPGASVWFVMGGGLTRSFGSLFMLLSLWQVYLLFRDGNKRALILSALFCSLTVLSHPEVGIHTAASCFLLWIFYGRTRRATFHAAVVALAALIFSSLWWGTVLAQHGTAPFFSALHTGNYGTSLWRNLYSAISANQTLIPILVTARIVGIFWELRERKYFLAAWFILPYLVEPRSAPSISFYPSCMFAAYTFSDAIPALFDRLRMRVNLAKRLELNMRRWANIGILLMIVYIFIESSLYGFKLINTSLLPSDRAAMNWIRQNTSSQGKFLTITGMPSSEVDPFVEWLPALTERRNQTTIQGFEWTLGPNFYQRHYDLARVQACQTAACIEDWSAKTGLNYDFIVIRTPDANENLSVSIEKTNNYTKVYSANGVSIYAKKKPG